jgi:ATP-dependent RNA helicase DeaD
MENFKSLGLNKNLVKALNEMGITVPTEIQAKVIPVGLNNSVDIIGQAATGTGKTAAFSLPILQKLDYSKQKIQALILCPTRELGQQIAKQIFKYSKYAPKTFTECVYGGPPINEQIRALKRTTHILVATPGRLIDLLDRGAVDLSEVQSIVLDEADEMLSLGFKKELDDILNRLNQVRNRWLFSATMPHEIKHIVNTHLSENAQHFDTAQKHRINKNVTHQFLVCLAHEKLPILTEFISSQGINRGIIFCKTKVAAQKLVEQLVARKINVAAIHGDLLQKDRTKAMRSFKNKSTQILIATDIAARGIDVENLAFVIHYEMPAKDAYFVHRSGRTGRGGKSGLSLSIVTSAELKQIRFFEKKLGLNFVQLRRK